MNGNMLIAHGGGPTPVINSSLFGALKEARQHPQQIEKVFAARFGAEGILANDLIDLTEVPEDKLNNLVYTPASAIGSCRRKLTEPDYPLVLENLRRNNIRYFFYNGGNDSMDTCHKIHQLAENEGYDLKVIGIPKTIDNDLVDTDNCPGFGSAARYAAISALELSADASALPIHVVILEVMGRNAGWLTAASALYKDEMHSNLLTYLPELPIEKKTFLNDVKSAMAQGRGLLVTVSEGLKDSDGRPVADTGIEDGFGHKIAGGVAQALADLIIAETDLRARAEKPGLLGRVSIAHVTEVDRQEAIAVGSFAVKSAVDGQSGSMVSILGHREAEDFSFTLRLVPLEHVANHERKFPLEWINAEGNGIKSAFHQYCLPLVGSSECHFLNLREGT